MDKKIVKLIAKIEAQQGQLRGLFSKPREKRGPLEIEAAILMAAIEGKKGGPIIHEANLNWNLFKEYTAILKERGLIEKDEAKQLFKTTKKGIEFLEAFSNLMEYLL